MRNRVYAAVAAMMMVFAVAFGVSVPAQAAPASPVASSVVSGGSGNFYVTRACGVASSSVTGIHRAYLTNSTPYGAYVTTQEYRWRMDSSWLIKPHSVTRDGVSVGTSGAWRVHDRKYRKWVFKWRAISGTYYTCTIYR